MSCLIGLMAAVLFSSFVYLRSFGSRLLSMPLLLVSIASHPSVNLPSLSAKNADGTFHIWSKVIFSPYFYFVRGFSALLRLLSSEPPYSEICDGLYVGGWPSSPDKLPPGNPAIIDCTCELPRRPEFMRNDYLCVPTWDTRSPQPADIELAVKWACQKREQQMPVFVHCAYGRGRSATVMCALLVALGVVEDWKDAEQLIKEKRPCIHVNPLQRKALEKWSKDRFSPLEKTG